MFILVKFKDRIAVQASDFKKQRNSIEKVISRKYCDKVIKGTGLCISLKEILKVEDAKLLYGDGTAYFEVTFTMIVFRPLKGELIVGKIHKATKEGIQISLQFYEDIYIHSIQLDAEATFDNEQKLWYTHLNQGEHLRWWYSLNSEIRFRVEKVVFNDSKKIKKLKSKIQANKQFQYQQDQLEPMVVYGSCKEQGLGLLGWW